ncbi:MAG: VWA domain-containing protein [Planctomycetota bacterium]|nr:VWA domain-containing protein [Planctomycetota bacterium]
MNAFRFHDPIWLLLLVPLAVIGIIMFRRRSQAAVLYSDVAMLRTLPVTTALRVKRMLPWLWLAGMTLLIVALARPQYGREEFRVRTEGIAVEMCIDRSGSMQAMDFEIDGKRVDRLTAVKDVFHEFVSGEKQTIEDEDGEIKRSERAGGKLSGRPDDQIGLIAFGGYANAKCPLTLDHDALLAVLDTVKIPQPIRNSRGEVINERLLQEEGMTAIGDALALAVDRLKDIDAKSKIIILLSDGENTAGVLTPAEAAEAAKAYGIKVYTIGVGSTGEAPFPAIDRFGRKGLASRMVRLDEETLKMLADTTGGQYFNATNTAALEEVYAEIDKLEKSKTKGRRYTQYKEMYRSAMLPGLASILLVVVLLATRFRSLP